MGQKAHNALKEALKCENQATQIEAALLLCEQGEQKGSEILIDAIHLVPKREQGRFIDALGTAKDPKAVPTIVELLSDEDHRINATLALGKIGDISVCPDLFKLLEIDNDDVKCAVAESIEKLDVSNGFSRIVATLSEQLTSGEVSGRFPEFVLEIAQKNNVSTPLELLTHVLLKSRSWEKRQNCAIAIGKAKNTEAVPVLIQALGDDDYDVRRETAKALGLIGDLSAETRLVEIIANDSNEDVKKAASKALEQIRRK
jgi:HEAT repeat protein